MSKFHVNGALVPVVADSFSGKGFWGEMAFAFAGNLMNNEGYKRAITVLI